MMNCKYEGKTKSVYELENGNYLLRFKDDVTGENGVLDPGANTVGLSIEGMGKGGVMLTNYFFQKLRDAGIPTHFVSADIENATLTVRPATLFGQGLEVICRFRAVGSFLRRYSTYAEEGRPLNAFVEVTLKDDAKQDPVISKDALVELGIVSDTEYETLKTLTQKASQIIKDDLSTKGLELYDIKLEFGRVDGAITLIDEISGGNMRVYKNGTIVEPLALISLVLPA